MASAPRGAALRQIQRVFGEGTLSGLTDSPILEKFVDGRDEAAFTALVERHGTMVLETCRAVLRNADAAEDAFQATFLVLVCKARSIRGRDALGSWLHRVALNSAAARIAIGDVISATAADLVRKSLQAMVLSNIEKCAAAALVFSVLGDIAWGLGLLRQAQDRDTMKGPAPASVSNTSQLKAEQPTDAGTTISYEGRVLDSGGRPFAGAAISLIGHGLKQPKNAQVRATSGADGRFRFVVPKSDLETPRSDILWPYITVVARAKGFAFGVANDHRGDGKELTIRLVPDDVVVTGRIIDLEGRPVANVAVTVLSVRVSANASLDRWLKALEERNEHHTSEREFLLHRWEAEWEPSIIPPARTGPDGRFRIQGIGRERVATLQIEGPTIETQRVEVRTRAGESIRVPAWKGFGNSNLITNYGANFEHVAGPTRAIKGIVRDQDTGKPLAGVMLRAERSLSDSTNEYVQSISDAQGRFRLVGLPRGKEGAVVAVPPSDVAVYGARHSDVKLPADETLPYLRARVAVVDERGIGPLHLDIGMKRGVWISGRVIDKTTRKPVRGQVEYFVFNDNRHLQEYRSLQWPMIGPHLTSEDGTFRLVAFPGPGVLAGRADEDRYIRGSGVESLKHLRNQSGFLECQPRMVGPDEFHALAEIDPAPGTASLSHDVLLETGRTLSVTVLGPDAKPLRGTLVSGLKDFQYTGAWRATPADASTHTIESLRPGKPRVVTFAHQGQHLTGELVLQGDETAPQTITLRPWGVLTGRVVNADGEPWGEAEFQTILTAEGFPKVGKDGRFKVVGLVPGKPYTLDLVKDFVVRGTVAKNVKVGPGEVKDLGDLVPETPKSE